VAHWAMTLVLGFRQVVQSWW